MMSYKRLIVCVLGIIPILFSSHLYALDINTGGYETANPETSVSLISLQHNDGNPFYNIQHKPHKNNRLNLNNSISRFIHFKIAAKYRDDIGM